MHTTMDRERQPPANLAAAGISICDLTVGFGSGPPVLQQLSCEVSPGEIVALVGASGCGKSTLLRAVANLLQPRSGSITFHSAAAPRRSGDLAYVFQDATLLPWRTVSENVGLPLELGRGEAMAPGQASREERQREAIAAALQTVGLAQQAADQFPRELSGGMRMRTSLARALVTDPNVLLLDEPFAALDDLLRTRLNDLILQLWTSRRRTIVFVTHNIAEAIFLSHKIAILAQGVVARSIDNPLPWPRTAEDRSSLEFAALYGRVSRALAEVSV
ncbi:MAG: ATP-binding cassette domain-containing protein [Planctomycetales bacterium]|nr:ATP-binding cassette domain-containing protein [Planctomycetales bacterium]